MAVMEGGEMDIQLDKSPHDPMSISCPDKADLNPWVM